MDWPVTSQALIHAFVVNRESQRYLMVDHTESIVPCCVLFDAHQQLFRGAVSFGPQSIRVPPCICHRATVEKTPSS